MHERIQTYEQAIDFLHGRIDYERVSASLSATDFKLERMRGLLEQIDNPHRGIPVVHIAGTKGKGSTAFLIAEVLRASGYRVGLFTSPHIECFEERIRINGTPVSRTELVRRIDRIATVAARIDAEPGALNPTFFELTTALGWLHFREQKVDIAVLETGLGGRLDTTNVCEPVVTVITTISRDHTQILGSTLAQIAREKAGIIKPGIPVVSGVEEPEPRQVIEQIAQQHQSPMTTVGTVESSGGFRERPDSGFIQRAGFRMRGPHQVHNARVAFATVRVLQEGGWVIPEEAIETGSNRWNVPARIEVVGHNPLQILDAAHNWASAQALLETLQDYEARPRLLVFGTSADKDARGLLRRLLPVVETIVLTEFQSPRAIPLPELARLARSITARPLHLVRNSIAAWKTARRLCPPGGLCCAAGSFYLAAEIRQHLVESSEAEQRSAVG